MGKGIRSSIGTGVINELVGKQHRNGESRHDLETLLFGTVRDAGLGFGILMLVAYLNKWFFFGGQ